ncbi:alpha/beta fold hydrolase [Aquabacterium humicola]|uniref:alpha/beta fold hydrolase n=1 Tax=Aquabacterium humicola TaxID=3237377 RepID=UPI0025432611|nr:alpha/beta hydrolase [Rubrivivax pictus]
MTPATTPVPAQSLRRVALADRLHLEVFEQGPRDGLPLLLLHGITDSWRSFEPVLPHLGPQWRVIVPSQRGHGDSDKPATGYCTDDFVADLVALIEALALPPVIVVGHSMGSTHALRLAADRPDLVRGLVGLGTFARYGDKPELLQWVAEAVQPLADPVPRALVEDFQLGTLARAAAPGLVERMVDESLKVPAAVWREAFAGLLEDDFCDRLHRIEVPALLVVAEADAYVPVADAERLQRAMPQARIERWAGAGHALHWEEPARCAASLVAFARQVAGMSAAAAC